MAKQHFVQLAMNYEEKHHIGGCYVSEKLDGVRAIWDGGVSRGLDASEVPYCNKAKHSRFKNTIKATGLWSRYGQPIQAPDWWLDKLPGYCCDGELWMGPGTFQKVVSIVKSIVTTSDWTGVQYKVFDVPSIWDLFDDREMNETNFKLEMRDCIDWVCSLKEPSTFYRHSSLTFREFISSPLYDDLKIRGLLHHQIRLDNDELSARLTVKYMLGNVESQGGEGLMIRAANSRWTSERTYNLLKVKTRHDAEGVVCGYTFGRQTELGSKLLGMMGALIVSYNGHQLELSGFTDAEREFDPLTDAKGWGIKNPGKKAPIWVTNPRFPVGSKVTFKYRELSDTGIPKEATYWRGNNG